MNTKPSYWFKTIDELVDLTAEPDAIEFLIITTGETFIHTYGTVYWNYTEKKFNIKGLNEDGITHWRIPTTLPEFKKFHKNTKVPTAIQRPIEPHAEHLNINPEFVNI